jgi:hypothetical protein
MLTQQVLVEMLRGEAAIAGPIQPLDLLLLLARRTLARGLPQTPVQQAALTRFSEANAPAAEW